MSDTDKKQELMNSVNNYQQTIKALLAFSSFVVHDGTNQRPNSNFGIGRKMTPSSNNKITSSSDITPDLVAQKSLDYGIVAEVKKSLPNNNNYWNKYVEQFRKYDDDLTGWWTDDKKITVSNSLMLIHQSRSRAFVNFIKNKLSSDPTIVSKNTGIVEFNSSEETASFYFFRLEHGEILDDEIKTKLDNGISIPLDKVLRAYPNINYYDSEPDTVLILTDLWSDVFPSRIPDGEHDEESNVVKIKVSVHDITNELQKAYGSKNFDSDERSVEFPKPRWIKKALDELVRFKMAVPPSGDNFEYVIHYKPIRTDILERFIDLYAQDTKEAKVTHEKQQPLFDNEEN